MNARAPRKAGTSFVLLLLSFAFAISGLSRLGIGVAEVIAAEALQESTGQSTEVASDPGDLLQALRAREERLSKAEADLAERQTLLAQTAQDIARQLDALKEAELQLEQTLQRTASASEGDINRLVNVYEHMKPQQAAELFSQMETAFAAGFMARLRPDFAGEVMANLDPIKAYAISAVLAGRHARTPQD